MARKMFYGPSKLILRGDSDTVIGSINEIRKSGPLKIVRALKYMTLRAQMTLGNFCLF